VVHYKDCLNYAPSVKRGPARGLIDFFIEKYQEILKNLLVKIYKA